jgi:hypothetical protein
MVTDSKQLNCVSLHSRLSTLTVSFGAKWLAPEDTLLTVNFSI